MNAFEAQAHGKALEERARNRVKAIEAAVQAQSAAMRMTDEIDPADAYKCRGDLILLGSLQVSLLSSIVCLLAADQARGEG